MTTREKKFLFTIFFLLVTCVILISCAAGGTNFTNLVAEDVTVSDDLAVSGNTDIAGTMVIAELAGIRVFATGGIGGVHRGHLEDVSADLMALALRRCSAETAARSTSKTSEAVARCTSSPSWKAANSPGSADRWAMMRSSIWE